MVECFNMCKLNWPPFSEVSSFECPDGGKSSKFCTKRPNVIPIIGKASIIPGQLLLPTPKRTYLKSLPFTSTLASSSKNLSGLKSCGFFQLAGLLASHHAFTRILLLAGMSNPPSLASRRFMCGTNKGLAILSGRVSLIIACRYGSLWMSGSVICTPGPSTVSISFRSFCFPKKWKRESNL